MRTLKTLVAAAALVLTTMAAATTPGAADWQAGARQADRAYWAAYNRVDPAGMNAMLADDVEFYHDRGGQLMGKAKLAAINSGMLTSENKLRREEIPGTVRFFPMREGDRLYGVLVTGEHQFFVIAPGKPEFLAGRAAFTQLMTWDGSAWKISRIFSYEHADTP